MVYIKKVEIQGFKSFGYTTKVIHLEKGLICITGPNGSGKSNLLDAIAFALGENSTKALRVDKLHSLFYDGLDDKTKKKSIRVSISLDNSDRGIPLDSDIVTITREMPLDGDSIYLLNGKQVPKSTIINLLEVAFAIPTKLNNVQQGMIMRIAEMNPEERRKVLEDIVGLSFFDKKKEEALKQLEEADRKLEVALARMNEIRKRIDELEIERNNQLRFNYLEKEIKRFNTIKIINKLKRYKKRKEELENIINVKKNKQKYLVSILDNLKQELNKLEDEKDSIIKELDTIGKSKATLSVKISDLIIRSEQLKISITTSKERIRTIGNEISSIIKEREVLRKRIEELLININELENKCNSIYTDKENLKVRVDELNNKIAILNRELEERVTKENNLLNLIKDKETKLAKIRNSIASELERLNIIDENIKIDKKKVEDITKEIKNLEYLLNELIDIKDQKEKKIHNIEEEVKKLVNKKENVTKYINEALNILEQANIVVNKYHARLDASKEMDPEGYSIVELLKEKEPIIIGVLKDLISYDKIYSKAIISAGNEWLNAIVVKSVSDALMVIEKAKNMNIKKIKIIPLDIIEGLTTQKDIGKKRLSDVINTNYRALVDFIFSVYIADTPIEARKLAEEGYNAVTLEGYLFNAKLSSIRFSNIERLKDITKLVLLNKSLDELEYILSRLNKLIIKKKEEEENIKNRLKSREEELKNESEMVKEINLKIDNVNKEMERYKKIEELLNSKLKELEDSKEKLSKNIENMKNEEKNMINEIEIINGKLREINKDSIINKLKIVDKEKRELANKLEGLEVLLREYITKLTSYKTEYINSKRRVEEITIKLEELKKEAKNRVESIKKGIEELKLIEKELSIMREEEQKIINISANAMNILKDYDAKIKELREEERKLTKELSLIEKELSLHQREFDDITNEEEKLAKELPASVEYDEIEVEVLDNILNELTNEYENIKRSINQLADKSYRQLIDGYKNMSYKRNQLEEERNSIVKFIEDIDKEKKRIFLDSFEKVDREVRHIFATMTDNLGSAWLELEDPENVFERGLLLMIQFPNKQPRESTSLSGGEKTIAAITFLLALQSLKVSPYYLFDEIDAHLDAQNTERLLKILLERSKNSQIILVTLKDIIVAHADIVYGIYAKNGVTNIIRYKAPMKVNIKVN